ncbi:BRCT-containing protein 1 [Choanephora cucurbitarum]|uniref:BRCT-containing protein 1 n=1 Tax=Choanephora cucurbitarum TaxID=101091 RepID=A0A1C7N5V2_9FUNG|nr:BRCT-containing protein 1 [Choanephora cucurbitarum]
MSKDDFELKLGRHINDKKTVRLFQDIIYAIDQSLAESVQVTLKNILINNGGIPAYSEHHKSDKPNLYISQTHVDPDVPVSVTPLWVEKAISNGFVHNTKYYAPDQNQFLSGQVFILLDLPIDNHAIYEHIELYGGQYRDELTQDITCLICIDPRGSHYNECVDRNIPIVLPQWLDDCFRCHCLLDYNMYRFPSPSIYYHQKPLPATLYPHPTDTTALSNFLPPHDKIAASLSDQVIYFGQDIMADECKQAMIPFMIDRVQAAGGRFISGYNRHLVTIVILKYRSSSEYKQAIKDKKIIASFWWLSNTLMRGYYCSPLDSLLDYPVPKVGISDMKNCVMCVTGFKGVARVFINTLIVAAGARYSPELNSDTTHLICGGGLGRKYQQLTRYPHVVLVNHLWLEECYAQWRRINHLSDRRYTYIPKENYRLANTVGKTPLLPHIVDLWKHYTCDMVPQIVYEEYQDTKGFINEKKPRQAAIRALSVLNDILIPDVNAYEKEIRLMQQQNRHKQASNLK